MDQNVLNAVYEPRWQALRVSLQGTWNTSPEQIEINLTRLRQYLEAETSWERIDRVHNLLEMVLRGYSRFSDEHRIQSMGIMIQEFIEKIEDINIADIVDEPLYSVKEEWDKLDSKTQKRIIADMRRRYLSTSHLPRHDLKAFLAEIGIDDIANYYQRRPK